MNKEDCKHIADQLTIKGPNCIAMRIVICAISMLHTLILQELTKNSHTACCVCYANHNIFQGGVFFEDIHLILVDCLPRGSAMENLKIHDDATKVPFLNIVECIHRVCCTISPSPVVTCPRSLNISGGLLCQCTTFKYCSSHSIC